MTWAETLRTGWAAIRAHRLRSVLTMLGILIGISAVDPHRRARPGRAGQGARADQRAGQQPADRLARQQHHRRGRPRRLRHRLDAHRSPTPPRSADDGRARHQPRSRRRRRASEALVTGTHQLDTHGGRHHALLADGARPHAGVRPVPHRRPRSSTRAARGRARLRHRLRAVRRASSPVGQTRHRSTARRSPVIGVLTSAGSDSTHQPRRRHGRRPDRTDAQRARPAARPATPSSTIYVRGDVATRPSAAAYQEANAMLLDRCTRRHSADADFTDHQPAVAADHGQRRPTAR